MDKKNFSQQMLIGLIAEPEVCIGFLLAGIGDVGDAKKPPNFLVVEQNVTDEIIADYFNKMVNRSDVAIILIGADVMSRFSGGLVAPDILPIVLEIPTKFTIPYESTDNFRK